MTKPIYNCTQQELYTVCRSGWNSCSENLDNFAAFKARYTETFIDERLSEVDIAEGLPDPEQREEEARLFRVELKNKATECLAFWQKLKRYISDAFPAGQLQIKLDAAGQLHYSKAANDDWNSLSRLLVNGNTFITDNTTELTANENMPDTFPPAFTAAKLEFDGLLQSFLDATKDSRVETQEKITANNGIYKNLMSMFLDGQEIFKNNEAVKKRFTFSQVLLIVAGPGAAGLKGHITDSNGQPITVTATLSIVETGRSTQSDENAQYEFNQLSAGNYTLDITAPGYQQQQLLFQIETSTVKTLDITLQSNE